MSMKFRKCSQTITFAWMLASHMVLSKKRNGILLLALCLCSLIFLKSVVPVRQVGRYSKWLPRPLPRTESSAQYFVLARDLEIYMYSAIASYNQLRKGDIGIVITSLDATVQHLDCCVLLDHARLFVTPVEEHFFYHTMDVTILSRIHEYFTPGYYRARQYLCQVPEIGRIPSHATLKSSSAPCSTDLADYLPVHTPTQFPGGLAVCAKIAHSGGLDPEKVIEWFEVQRLLGVDKVLLYDMGNPVNLTRVFRYYQNMGLLDLQPYELPGYPANRTLMEKDKRTHQFHHDESMAVLECRQRMSGFSYVMSHDLDEFIIPRRDITLKQFFKEKMEYYQDSAGFYFDTEFFIYNWGPTNPEEDLMLTRYRKATKPHWECTKYVYLPARVLSSTTHSIYPLHPYTTYRIEPEEAVLHHYRRCPDDVWSTCFPETIIDHIMTRYTDLYSRVLTVRQATGVRPSWNTKK
ncbi:uncharacterized protein LOC106071649 isoform X1 [Biomphalaria glabrata]|uniref:Glycosyltransferase family 92 protein n=2 Tax=Biomphalaria glabrata TaxID=6526 RepID=A0A9W3B959_BIOGL|nr:uncharacterized protein LOC106071649 isoform X1 [Biomphalaria glabrata]XP_013087277.2 uncharacterized protein LOC106071649 isoform X1 [Biomphalaria glabrata]XP_013087283.2 uncharacterized protein LOC106071649 isoform X1 [Biomphalaria glabrata]XP_013087296.2 uncharacterized protein LOC106071649 isoform X1 [Biomphalaria glabrata]XP_055896075.1 uncharacterized protein LOC106071649 isoform X1 [Biomphalaria glabrata]XP_055896076.1 uncharacterized protein LOC106071649 isoform X1 [Biomphalaria gla